MVYQFHSIWSLSQYQDRECSLEAILTEILQAGPSPPPIPIPMPPMSGFIAPEADAVAAEAVMLIDMSIIVDDGTLMLIESILVD